MIEQLHMKCAGNWVSNLKVPVKELGGVFLFIRQDLQSRDSLRQNL
jgi:hypothetical protein